MRLHRTTTILLAASLPVLAIGTAGSSLAPLAGAAGKPVRLGEATMIVEVNATDRDAGLQVFLDAEPWAQMTITNPDGRRILAVNTSSRQRLFPEGRYVLVGTTIEGRKLVGRARLSHDIPDGPQITSPADGATIPRDGVVAAWNPVPEPDRIDVAGYRAIVEREDPPRVFSVDLPASVTSVTIPSEFLEPATRYKLEVQAIEASGNQTLREITFHVS